MENKLFVEVEEMNESLANKKQSDGFVDLNPVALAEIVNEELLPSLLIKPWG